MSYGHATELQRTYPPLSRLKYLGRRLLKIYDAWEELKVWLEGRLERAVVDCESDSVWRSYTAVLEQMEDLECKHE